MSEFLYTEKESEGSLQVRGSDRKCLMKELIGSLTDSNLVREPKSDDGTAKARKWVRLQFKKQMEHSDFHCELDGLVSIKSFYLKKWPLEDHLEIDDLGLIEGVLLNNNALLPSIKKDVDGKVRLTEMFLQNPVTLFVVSFITDGLTWRFVISKSGHFKKSISLGGFEINDHDLSFEHGEDFCEGWVRLYVAVVGEPLGEGIFLCERNSMKGQIQLAAAGMNAGERSSACVVYKTPPKKHPPVSQIEAAFLCGVSVSTIKNWEKKHGTPPGWPGRWDTVRLQDFARSLSTYANRKADLKIVLRGGATV